MGIDKSLKEHLKNLSECFKESISGAKKLSGDSLEEFKDIFSLEGEPLIYFNEYNIIITQPSVNEALSLYLKKDELVVTVELKELEMSIWVYSYYNQRIFNDYLK